LVVRTSAGDLAAPEQPTANSVKAKIACLMPPWLVSLRAHRHRLDAVLTPIRPGFH
jgi:hypothetical protein